MANKHKNIKYLNRDFISFKSSLEEYTKTYFPNTYSDFTTTSTGMLFIEMASYVGDVLSFYLDNQIQENFIQYSRQLPNLYNMSYMLGYHPKVTTVASTMIDFYQLLPAKTLGNNTVPDYDYCLTIPPNTSVVNEENTNSFIIEGQIDFSYSSSTDPTEITIYQINGDEPVFYLIKKSRKGISAQINSTIFNFSTSKKFDVREIKANNIIGILDVKDNEGNFWYEVPNLAQNVIMDKIYNINRDLTPPSNNISPDPPSLLKLKKVPRRFTTRFKEENLLKFEFGAGSTGYVDEEIIPNPDNVGKGLPFGLEKMTTAYSPLNFMYTNTYGMAPSNTALNVRYLTGGGLSSNVEANSLTVVNDTNIKFNNPNLINSTLANKIFNSVASNNPNAADGGKDGDSIEELRQNSLGNFQTQLRSVTPQDHLVRALSMSSDLGAISKAHIQPQNANERSFNNINPSLNLYVLTYDIDKKLQFPSKTIKNNLKTYLSEYRMINDQIEIKNAYIINIGLEFDIIVLPNYNNNEVLTKCISTLEKFFNIDNWQINEPIILKDLYILLDRIEGVQTVKNIYIKNKIGEDLGYSNFAYDVTGATFDNVIYPSIDPMIFEIKYPDVDIKGRVVNL